MKLFEIIVKCLGVVIFRIGGDLHIGEEEE